MKLTHKIAFAYIDADEKLHTGGINIDRITPRLAEIVDRYVTSECEGRLVSFEVRK